MEKSENRAKKKDENTKNAKHRLELRVTEDTWNKLQYWAQVDGYSSVNALIPDLIDLYASIRSGDYRLPTLEQQRLNQLIEEIDALSGQIGSLEQIAIAGFDSLVSVSRGDNYLLEQSNEEE